MTKDMLLLVGLAIAASIGAAVVQSRTWRQRASGDIRPNKPITEREQPMFFRLHQAFPDDVVLSQVSFSALLTAKDWPPASASTATSPTSSSPRRPSRCWP